MSDIMYEVGDKVIVKASSEKFAKQRDGEVVAILYGDDFPVVVKHKSFSPDNPHKDIYQNFSHEGRSPRQGAMARLERPKEYRYMNVYEGLSTRWDDRETTINEIVCYKSPIVTLQGEFVNGKLVSTQIMERSF